MSVSERVGAVAPAPRPAPRPERRPGEHLRPVRPAVRRRSAAVPVLVGTGIVITALLALAVMHALLIGGQIRLDDMQREVASETEEIHRLRLRVAELESPDRVLEVARQRLGMVQPSEVGYLPPVEVDIGEAERTRVPPAEVPEPDPPAPDESAQDDEDDVDDAGGADDADDAVEATASPDGSTDAVADPATDSPVAGGGDE